MGMQVSSVNVHSRNLAIFVSSSVLVTRAARSLDSSAEVFYYFSDQSQK